MTKRMVHYTIRALVEIEFFEATDPDGEDWQSMGEHTIEGVPIHMGDKVATVSELIRTLNTPVLDKNDVFEAIEFAGEYGEQYILHGKFPGDTDK